MTAYILAVPVRGPGNQNLDVACQNGWNVTLQPGATFDCRATAAYGAAGFYRVWADWADPTGRWHAGQLGVGWSFDVH